MISIIVALESEAKHFVSQIENKKESILAGKKVYIGSVSGKEISLIISGIIINIATNGTENLLGT